MIEPLPILLLTVFGTLLAVYALGMARWHAARIEARLRERGPF